MSFLFYNAQQTGKIRLGPSLISLLLKDHFAAAAVAASAVAADVAGAQKIEWVAGVETDRMRWRG